MKTLFLILPISLFASVSIAAEVNGCHLAKYAEYGKTQQQWQQDSTNLIQRHKPELGEVANIYMHDQLVLIEKNVLAVELLLSSTPEKLKTHEKMNRWLGLDREDEKALARQSKRFDELLIRASAARERAPHPDGDKLRSSMRTEIMLMPEFQDLLANFNKKVQEVGSTTCNEM